MFSGILEKFNIHIHIEYTVKAYTKELLLFPFHLKLVIALTDILCLWGQQKKICINNLFPVTLRKKKKNSSLKRIIKLHYLISLFEKLGLYRLWEDLNCLIRITNL